MAADSGNGPESSQRTADRSPTRPPGGGAAGQGIASTARGTDLAGYLDRLRAELDRIDQLRAGWANLPAEPTAGSRAAIILGHLARLQRLSGWAMRTAVQEARDSGLPWEALAPAAQVRSLRLRNQVEAGGRIVVDDAPGERHQRDAPTADGGPSAATDGASADGVLNLIERHLEAVVDHLREAAADHAALDQIATEATHDPVVAGRAAAHRTLALNRWDQALGARAQLEALYEELAGKPSRRHTADTRQLERAGVPANPVGLTGRDPASAAFLDEQEPKATAE